MDIVGDGEILDERVYELVTHAREPGLHGGRSVYYEVTARMERGFDLADPMVSELSEVPALEDLTLQTEGAYPTIRLRLRFESMGTLTAWRDAGVFESIRETASAVTEKVSVR